MRSDVNGSHSSIEILAIERKRSEETLQKDGMRISTYCNRCEQSPRIEKHFQTLTVTQPFEITTSSFHVVLVVSRSLFLFSTLPLTFFFPPRSLHLSFFLTPNLSFC